MFCLSFFNGHTAITSPTVIQLQRHRDGSELRWDGDVKIRVRADLQHVASLNYDIECKDDPVFAPSLGSGMTKLQLAPSYSWVDSFAVFNNCKLGEAKQAESIAAEFVLRLTSDATRDRPMQVPMAVSRLEQATTSTLSSSQSLQARRAARAAWSTGRRWP